jgi:uncharacterized membrane protein YidH (DUF202 family)
MSVSHSRSADVGSRDARNAGDFVDARPTGCVEYGGMLLALLVAGTLGAGGLAASALAYVNRDDLDDRPNWRQRLPFVTAVLIVVVIAVVVGVLLANDHTRVGRLAR